MCGSTPCSARQASTPMWKSEARKPPPESASPNLPSKALRTAQSSCCRIAFRACPPPRPRTPLRTVRQGLAGREPGQLAGRALVLPIGDVEHASLRGGVPDQPVGGGLRDEPLDGLGEVLRVVAPEAEVRLADRGVEPPFALQPGVGADRQGRDGVEDFAANPLRVAATLPAASECIPARVASSSSWLASRSRTNAALIPV